jgi:2-polyprenyl-3-methyl-5-hydroxy-6-metoxy-1,4-benzoquinol methylase
MRDQPAGTDLDRLFAESEGHASIYVDHDSLESRMRQVIAPKIAWCFDLLKHLGCERPRRSLDVGAGGGHFVAGMAREGIDAVGLEMSRHSRAFAQQAFGIDLKADDFLKRPEEPFDLITFWGLLEYTPSPRDFLARARRNMSDRPGLLVVEVPRADALGTKAQQVEGAVIARHMDPTTHVNTFTDESLCTALVEEGFRPVAAWYFGMDVYEVMVQTVARLGDDGHMARLADMLPVLQQACDLGRQCDDIVVGAVPA